MTLALMVGSYYLPTAESHSGTSIPIKVINTPPVIDGIAKSGEYVVTSHPNFTINYQGHDFFVEYDLAYDHEFLYGNVRIKMPDSYPGDILDVMINFDNNHDGVHDIGEDNIGIHPYNDRSFYRDPNTGNSWWRPDQQEDGYGTTTSSRDFNIPTERWQNFEFKKPLCSGQITDFCITYNDTIGFKIGFALSAPSPFGGLYINGNINNPTDDLILTTEKIIPTYISMPSNSLVEYVSLTSILYPNQTRSISVTCPINYIALSGGFSSNLDEVDPLSSNYFEDNRFSIEYFNSAQTFAQVKTTVTCLKNDQNSFDVTETFAPNSKLTNHNESISVTGTCPHGYVSTGSGFGDQTEFTVFSNAPISSDSLNPSEWEFKGKNNARDPDLLYGKLQCLKIKDGNFHLKVIKPAKILVSPFEYKKSELSCPTNDIAVGHGFSFNSFTHSSLQPIQLFPSVDSNKRIISYNNTKANSAEIEPYVLCLSETNPKYDVPFKTGGTTPPEGFDIQGIKDSADEGAKDVYFHLQFYELPTQVIHQLLANNEINLIEYLSSKLYVAKIPLSRIDGINWNDFGVRAAFPITTDTKVDPIIYKETAPEWAGIQMSSDMVSKVPPDMFTSLIHFHDDVTKQEILDAISISEGYPNYVAESSSIASAFLNLNHVQKLSERNTVQFITYVDPPLEPESHAAQEFIGIKDARRAFSSLNGDGVKVMVYDNAAILPHIHLDDKVIIAETNILQNGLDHPTKVAGIIASSVGQVADHALLTQLGHSHEGVSPNVQLYSYGIWDTWQIHINDHDFIGSLFHTNFSDMEDDFRSAMSNDVDLSNLSMGHVVTERVHKHEEHGRPDFSVECTQLGSYSSTSQLLDRISYDGLGHEHGPLLIIKSAGNERQYDDCNVRVYNQRGWNTNNAAESYGIINSPATAKNLIVVGSIDTATGNFSAFSNFGPTSDGRLKPDIMAPGCNTSNPAHEPSLQNTGYWFTGLNNNYVQDCGTSFSAPLVTGLVSLLNQEWRITHSERLPPHTAKAILIHTADDPPSPKPGPNYQFGWGIANALRAITLVHENPNEQRIFQGQVNEGQVFTQTFTSNGDNPLRATLVWDDPPGAITVEPSLQSDLDLVVKHNNRVFYPWVLDPNNPNQPAKNSTFLQVPLKDELNNVEVVDTDPISGNWVVEVTGEAVPFSPQKFTLIISDSITLPNTSNGGGSVNPDDPCQQSELSVGDRCIPYTMSSGSITSAEINQDNPSLVINIDSNSDGSITLNPPEEFFTGIEHYSIDGQSPVFLTDDNEITINFRGGDRVIEIHATRIIPEFSTIAVLVLGVSVLSLILVSSRSSLKLNPKN
ncbi:S8 family serine peptidase [Nitrosopumilus sp. b1]|uniref:S8 family serine peptidase n=1 Tax=Nitrosopumilus sp. b1 TaxID=2109907 RepID=UPI0015F6A009|nr:S8 family serine peptidase [Nitrosopumilus sp. b1]